MRKTSRNRLAPRTIGTAVAVVLLLLVVLLWRNLFAGFLWRVFTPLLMHNPLSAVAAQFYNKSALQADNAALRGELASTSAALADRNLLYQENLELKASMGRNANGTSILAGIITRPPTSPYDTLMIDAGKAQGVVQGALVSAGGTTLIGVVNTVYSSTARVTLFSSPGESYQALLMETSAHGTVPVVVEGQGGGSLTTEVPANVLAAVGDDIVFPGITDGLSSTVVAVDKKNGESFETLYLRLPANPQELRFVEVQK